MRISILQCTQGRSLQHRRTAPSINNNDHLYDLYEASVLFSTKNLKQIFPEIKQPRLQFLHSCISERFTYSHDRFYLEFLSLSKLKRNGLQGLIVSIYEP
jgi:hypothetical protein